MDLVDENRELRLRYMHINEMYEKLKTSIKNAPISVTTKNQILFKHERKNSPGQKI